MDLFAVFAFTLMLAVLLSGLAQRSILSTTVVFLAAGFLVGQGGLAWVDLSPMDPLVSGLATAALFAVLFTDGMHAAPRELRKVWSLPGRALAFGLPLTFLLGGIACYYLTDLGWVQSFLLSAVLAPTDPVFAEAIVGRKEIPARLRTLLNVESGLNDGLALPIVVVLIAVASHDDVDGWVIAGELILGVALGVVVPWVLTRLEASRWFEAQGRYRALHAFAIGLILFAVCEVTHANPFLAAFTAGATMATVSPRAVEAFAEFGELIAELIKLAALLTFGALLSVTLFAHLGWEGWLLVAVLLLAVRPMSLAIALPGQLDRLEWIAAAWFGPKGFASVTYGLLVLTSGVPDARKIAEIVAATVAISIVAHSSTDVVVARWFTSQQSGKDPGASDAGADNVVARGPS